MCELVIIFWKVVTIYYTMRIDYEILPSRMGMRYMIYTFIWDREEILDTSIYNGEASGTPLHEYEQIAHLKSLISIIP